MESEVISRLIDCVILPHGLEFSDRPRQDPKVKEHTGSPPSWAKSICYDGLEVGRLNIVLGNDTGAINVSKYFGLESPPPRMVNILHVSLSNPECFNEVHDFFKSVLHDERLRKAN